MKSRSKPLVCLTALLVCATAWPQENADPEVTRADLAASYLRFEKALNAANVDDARMAEINPDFDSATLAFFQRKFDAAIGTINGLTLSLMPNGEDSTLQGAMALRATVKPSVCLAGKTVPMVYVTPLYKTTPPAGKVELALQTAAGDIVLRTPVNPPAYGETNSISLAGAQNLAPGRYFVGLLAANTFIQTSALSIAPRSLDEIREENEARITAITSDGRLEQAVASVRARNALLTDTPSTENSAEFLFDPAVLIAEVSNEIAALTKGTNPFNRRTGDYWRVVRANDTVAPIRVYLPENLVDAERIPLVVAFHGAGGDENMFMDAYGASVFKEIANEHGFLAVSPLTYQFRGAQSAALFVSILEAVSADYAVDRDRVYILGHSMGGGAVTQLARELPDTVTAAAAIAGFGSYAGADTVPPTLVISAELDPIARPTRIGKLANEAIDAGLPVEYRDYAGQGHTIIVGRSLPDAVEWLLDR